MQNIKPKPLRFTEITKDGETFGEYSVGVNAEGIVSIHCGKLQKGGEAGMLIGQGPRERDVTKIQLITGAVIFVKEDFDTVFTAWQNAAGLQTIEAPI
jgi:hypothetical protein